MKLQTKIPLSKQSHNLISYDSKCLLLGSCFAENISEKLDYYKFENALNPLGILFHPIAIENLITRAINKDFFTEKDLVFNNEQWHCLDAHSCMSNSSKEHLLSNLNNALQLTNQQLYECSHIIITLGTSWVYRYLSTDKSVANCHKIPQKQFSKELLAVTKVSESLYAIQTHIKSVNPKAVIIFTVSPIRHLKDGFVENSQSKAHLISAIHEVVEPRKNIYYFPSYEIMIDELRDYRFYAEDMIHPNPLAIRYIWNAFNSIWISNEAQKIMTDVEAIQKGLLHKPFNSESRQHQDFIKTLKIKMQELQKQYPNLQF